LQTAHYFSTEQTLPGAFSLNFFAVVCDRVSGIFTSPRAEEGGHITAKTRPLVLLTSQKTKYPQILSSSDLC
jgi:hypothetical protein